MISVTYHDDLNEVQGDAQIAAALSAPQAGAPFDRLEWWRNQCQSFEILPLIAIARNENRGVILPLRRVNRRIEMLTCWYNFRASPVFFGHLDHRNDEPEQLLWNLFRNIAGEAPRLHLAPLPNEGREADRLVFALEASGWVVFKRQCDVNHVLFTKGRSYADYLATRPGPVRTTLKRKAHRIEVALFDHFDEAAWAAYEEIYARSWKPSEGSPAFLRRFAQEEGAAGRLRFALGLADGKPVAAQFWTVEHAMAFIHKLAHDESAKALSPGTTLTAALMERVIDRDGVAMVDFGTGNDGYKRDWMEDVRPRYRIDAYRPLWPGNWPAIGKHLLRRLAPGAKHG